VSDKKLSHSWTAETLAAKNKKDVETIRANAVRQNVADLIVLCDRDLECRRPISRPKAGGLVRTHAAEGFVDGYHFVCKGARGVVDDEHGRFRTGSWVVAVSNVERSLKFGAYVALHESRLERSYRQGKLVGYRLAPRDMLSDEDGEVQTKEGIEFLVEETAQPYSWVGEAAGEKGYKWSSSPSNGGDV
jgi:hypothetical protein